MSKATILVAGRSGQVARSLREAAAQQTEFNVVTHGRPELDITDRASVERAMAQHKPDLVINAAAYTAVDQAEEESAAAYAVNEQGPRLLAEISAARNLPLIHLSTDYVFDGKGKRPYREDDAVSPLGVYGASKLAGEQAVRQANPHHFILRTAWVYGAYGKNFLKTMLRVAASRDELSVVADQHGAPTSSHDIAAALLSLVSNLQKGASTWGTFHMAAQGTAVWADFAEAIFEESAALSGPTAQVQRISTEEYPTPAERPSYSVLDSDALFQAYNVKLPTWRSSVGEVVKRVIKEGGVG